MNMVEADRLLKAAIEWKAKIPKMTRVEMARLWRFAPAGHPVFANPELSEMFTARFAELGGMSPEISKRIGWD